MPRPTDPGPDAFAAAASKLLVGTGEARDVAASAVRVIEQLTRHLARLIGESGVRALLARSAALSNARFPWLAGAIPIIRPADSPWASLRSAFDSQDPRAVTGGFVALLSGFVELLQRLIGEVLVAHLMHDLWPDVFPLAAKETT